MRFLYAFIICLVGFVRPASAEDIVRVGQHFFNLDVGGNTITQVIAPATNTAGLYIRTASISNSGLVTILYASATPPVTPRDLNTRTIFESAYLPNGSWSQLQRSYFVPAGMGLWLGALSPASIVMTYDLLQ